MESPIIPLAQPIGTANIFTPRDGDHQRLRFTLAKGEMSKVGRGKPWSATLKLADGQFIKTRGVSCGFPNCFCDAELLSGPSADGS